MATHTMLLADCNPLFNGAVLTVDVTAPMEAAVAAIGSSLLDDIVSTTTTEGATTVDATAGTIALSPCRTREVHFRIPFAEVRRTLVVEEVQC
jgi:hypothetical protein